ncbi:MAG TPA: Zn-ribbon domain-containing OB-fold protein [Alphaproteobacteria bacterium]|jgi:uncharacterized OB-fold protein|nr:Zn-ribbon domain-containing OB-fold protein [Alphaproteobacteria bacterium]
MSYEKPLPALDPESTPFWQACKEHTLKIVKCGACGHLRFPPTSFCPACNSDRIEWVEASGKGTVFSWIVVRHPVPKDVYAGDVPYVVALVTLEEGVRMPTNIVGCAPEDVTAYMPVRVQFRDVTPEITLPVFAPA